MPDFSKLHIQRKSRAALLRQELRLRYFGTKLRGVMTLVGSAGVACLVVGIDLGGRYRAAEIGMPLHRTRSLQLTELYVRSDDFERQAVAPLREVFKLAAQRYSAAPESAIGQILERIGTRKTGSASAYRRPPAIRSPINFPIETVRNAREHLFWRGFNARSQPERQNCQLWFEVMLTGQILAKLEATIPGICPQGFSQSVPLSREYLARAIARHLEVSIGELGELIYCAHLIIVATAPTAPNPIFSNNPAPVERTSQK